MATKTPVGFEAVQKKGWWATHRYLVLRRLSQALFMGLFLSGPLGGYWIVKGNLASSLTLDILPLTDPMLVLQMLAARHWPEMSLIIGCAIVVAAYTLIGGRVYCSWVCPVNPVTDLANWMHRKLNLTKGWQPSGKTRFWLLGAVLVGSALTQTMVWEVVNPVALTHRAIIFGGSWAFSVLGAIFLFDLFVSRHGWCGHLCPMGATFALIGDKSLLRVSADRRHDCNDCMDCYAVCPELQVISPALRPGDETASPVILDRDCTNCGRCIDICSEQVFRFTHRFDDTVHPPRDVTSEMETSTASSRDVAA